MIKKVTFLHKFWQKINNKIYDTTPNLNVKKNILQPLVYST